jgi:hypothetical protein
MGGFALAKEEGSQINFRGTKMIVKVSGDDSDGRYSLIEMVHPPNIGPALHIHPNAPEAYYVLKGEYIIQCGTLETGQITWELEQEIAYGQEFLDNLKHWGHLYKRYASVIHSSKNDDKIRRLYGVEIY